MRDPCDAVAPRVAIYARYSSDQQREASMRSAAARHSPEAAFDAAAVLDHSQPTSIQHYAEGTAVQALRRHGIRVSRLRRRTRRLAERAFAERDAARGSRCDAAGRWRRRSGSPSGGAEGA